MSEPVEREVMPGVFVTDFRTPATAAAAQSQAADAADEAAAAQQRSESKQKEEAEADDDDSQHGDSLMGNAGSSSRSAPVQAERPPNAAYPRDLPNDAEELELELAALEQNMVQLVKSTQILQEELKENPDDQDFIDAVAENRATILRRSDRIQAVRRQLQALAPHRVEPPQSGAQQANATTSTAADSMQTSPSPPTAGQPDEQDGGLYL